MQIAAPPPLLYRLACSIKTCSIRESWPAASLLQAHGQEVLSGPQPPPDLLEAVISSVDGEKDPRCLLAGLRCVRSAVALYAAQPQHTLHSQRLEVGGGEG